MVYIKNSLWPVDLNADAGHIRLSPYDRNPCNFIFVWHKTD